MDVKKILYLECSSGISGDMAVASLLDLGTPEEKAAREELLLSVLESLPERGFEARVSRVEKSGIIACDFDVVLDAELENHDHDMEYLYGHLSSGCGGAARSDFAGHAHAHDEGRDCGHAHHHHHHHHRHAPAGSCVCDHPHAHPHAHELAGGHVHRNLADVTSLIEATTASVRAKELAVRIFGIVAEAEAAVHGKPVDEVRFHEVGAVDSIVDILAFAVCLDSLAADEVVVCELSEGRGSVRCQHGVIPVPVPAVLSIAAAYDVPLRIIDVRGELVTPTGAAIAAAARTRSSLPERFVVRSVGVGAGKRAYDTPGVVRAMLIEEA